MNEHTASPAGQPAPPDEPPVPWVNPEIQHLVEWRDRDIVVSVPVKSGTTWMMNIVHQLRTGGDREFDSIYAEVPWLEFVPEPGVTPVELAARVDAMPDHRRRAFKTHSPPGPLPFHAAGSGTDVQYIVVVRNPEEVLASMHPFINSHSDEWFELWKLDKAMVAAPDFGIFFEHMAKPMIRDAVFGFVAAWWPLRHEPNVLLMHFADMKRDHEGSVRRVADFLGYEPADGEWRVILECTSFAWMKRHERKFEGFLASGAPVLKPGSMMRKGRAGAARDEGVTPQMGAEIARIGEAVLGDRAALEWIYAGGSVPGQGR